MKVTSIETAVLHVPCPRPMSLEFPDHRMVAAFIDTDEGVRGFGYTLAYGSGGVANYAVDDIIAEGHFYTGHGCRYYKMKIHDPDPRKNVARVEAVKKALGDGVRMMVDVNQKLDVLATIKQAQMLEHLDLVWYEEPVLADDYAGLAEVARCIKTPVATGENHYTRFEFKELCERRAARYLMP